MNGEIIKLGPYAPICNECWNTLPDLVCKAGTINDTYVEIPILTIWSNVEIIRPYPLLTFWNDLIQI